jgi:hypothetical protein
MHCGGKENVRLKKDAAIWEWRQIERGDSDLQFVVSLCSLWEERM